MIFSFNTFFIFLISIIWLFPVKGKAQNISHIQQMLFHVNPALIADKDQSKAGIYYNSSQLDRYKNTEKTLAANGEILLNNIGLGVLLTGVENTQTEGNKFRGIKAGGGYLINLERKQGTRKFSFVPGIAYTYTRSNNKIYVDAELYTNGVILTKKNVDFANYVFSWPGDGHDLTLGLAYRSDKTIFGVDYTYSRQSVIQQNLYTTHPVPYNYFAVDKNGQAEEKAFLQKESESVLANKTFNWSQSVSSVYFSQRADFGRKKNVSLTFYTWFTTISRSGLIKDLQNSYGEDDNEIDFGVISNIKNIIFGVQLGTRVSEFILAGYKTDKFSVVAGYGGYKEKPYGSISLNYYIFKKEEEKETESEEILEYEESE